MTKRYRNVSIPEELYKKLDELVKWFCVVYVGFFSLCKIVGWYYREVKKKQLASRTVN